MGGGGRGEGGGGANVCDTRGRDEKTRRGSTERARTSWSNPGRKLEGSRPGQALPKVRPCHQSSNSAVRLPAKGVEANRGGGGGLDRGKERDQPTREEGARASARASATK